MNSFVNRLNAVAGGGGEYRETLKLSQLAIGEPHIIEGFRRVNTQYGPSIVVDLVHPKASIFLPKRYADTLSAADIQSMNSLNIQILSKGPFANGHGTNIEFV